MKQSDNNFVSMCRAVQQVLTKYDSTWNGQVAFTNQVNNFNNLMNDLSTVIADAELVSTGATTDKDMAEQNAVQLAVNLAKRASIYALEINNMELHNQLRVSKSTLLRRPDVLTLAKLRDIIARLSGISANMANYGVTPADVDDLIAATDTFDNLIVRPRNIIVERKGLNQDRIPALLNDLRMVLYKMDSLMNLFSGRDLAREYKNARIIVDLGKRTEDQPDTTQP